jgi:hypothetical protein
MVLDYNFDEINEARKYVQAMPDGGRLLRYR